MHYLITDRPIRQVDFRSFSSCLESARRDVMVGNVRAPGEGLLLPFDRWNRVLFAEAYEESWGESYTPAV